MSFLPSATHANQDVAYYAELNDPNQQITASQYIATAPGTSPSGAPFRASQVGPTIANPGKVAIDLENAGVSRMAIGLSNVEAGANSGSDLAVFSYSDAGAFLDTPLYISRNSGNVNVENALNVGPAGVDTKATIANGDIGAGSYNIITQRADTGPSQVSKDTYVSSGSGGSVVAGFAQEFANDTGGGSVEVSRTSLDAGIAGVSAGSVQFQQNVKCNSRLQAPIVGHATVWYDGNFGGNKTLSLSLCPTSASTTIGNVVPAGFAGDDYVASIGITMPPYSQATFVQGANSGVITNNTALAAFSSFTGFGAPANFVPNFAGGSTDTYVLRGIFS